MFDLSATSKAFAQRVDQNAPTILSWLAVGGVVGIVVSTYKQAPKAQEILARKRGEYQDVAPDDNETKKLVVIETAKELAPVVAPIAICTGLTIGCVIGSNQMHTHREAALTAAYIASDKALQQWKEASKKTLEKKDYEAVEKKVQEEKVKEVVAANGGLPQLPQNQLPGQHLFIDQATGQIFYDDLNRILRIVEHINDDFDKGRQEWISWNYLLGELGEKRVDGTNGDELGFNSFDGGVQLDYGSYVDDDTNIIYAYIDYPLRPRHSYNYC